jgi:hypothetical protein
MQAAHAPAVPSDLRPDRSSDLYLASASHRADSAHRANLDAASLVEIDARHHGAADQCVYI